MTKRIRTLILFVGFTASLTIALIVAAANISKGREVYGIYCANCHGPDGRGMLPSAGDFSRGDGLMRSDIDVFQRIRTGTAAMPAFEGILTEEETLDVIAYVRTFMMR
jgi:mono/diheme cytochrome c family protein